MYFFFRVKPDLWLSFLYLLMMKIRSPRLNDFDAVSFHRFIHAAIDSFEMSEIHVKRAYDKVFETKSSKRGTDIRNDRLERFYLC